MQHFADERFLGFTETYPAHPRTPPKIGISPLRHLRSPPKPLKRLKLQVNLALKRLDGGSTPSLATIILQGFSGTLLCTFSPL